MTVVSRKTEPMTRLVLRDNFHTLSDGEEFESETDLDSLDDKTCGAEPMTKLKMKQCSDCVRPERNCSMRQNREGSARKVTTDVNV